MIYVVKIAVKNTNKMNGAVVIAIQISVTSLMDVKL